MKERKTIRKWFWVWDFEKEEQWLNEMAFTGWTLCEIGFCKYTFEKSEPGEYAIRLEMREDDQSYLELMKETKAEYIGRMVQWIYFRKKAEDGSFDIFSDLESRIQHLDKIGKMLLLIGIANLLIGVNASYHTQFGWINILCATLLMYALGRINGKKEALEKEKMLYN